MVLDWELLDRDEDNRIDRAKVLGGWLVRFHGCYKGGLTFVPDPKHKWKLE
jgi:hypothetical protein